MIRDYLRERKSSTEYSEQHQKAIKIFLSQQEAIKEISGTKGYKEILAYLDREIEACDSRLNTTKDQEAWKEAYAVRTTCNSLKQFLNNLANS